MEGAVRPELDVKSFGQNVLCSEFIMCCFQPTDVCCSNCVRVCVCEAVKVQSECSVSGLKWLSGKT